MPRRKTYKHGDRVNFYIKQDVPQEMLDWINLQSDLSLFVLHGMEVLYKQVGRVDVAGLLPRNHRFSLHHPTAYLTLPSTARKRTVPFEAEAAEAPSKEESQDAVQQREEPSSALREQEETAQKSSDDATTKEEQKTWGGIEAVDDPYA